MLFSDGEFVHIGSGKPCDVSKVKNALVKCMCLASRSAQRAAVLRRGHTILTSRELM